MSEWCPSVWRSAHGPILCDRAAGHGGKHEGVCDVCADNEDPSRVTWTDEMAANPPW